MISAIVGLALVPVCIVLGLAQVLGVLGPLWLISVGITYWLGASIETTIVFGIVSWLTCAAFVVICGEVEASRKLRFKLERKPAADERKRLAGERRVKAAERRRLADQRRAAQPQQQPARRQRSASVAA